VVQVVVPNDCPAHRPLATGVDGSRVIGLVTYAVDLVELDEMVVAPEPNSFVRDVMDQIVGGPMAHPTQRDGRAADPIPPALVVDVIVFGVMAGRGEC